MAWVLLGISLQLNIIIIKDNFSSNRNYSTDVPATYTKVIDVFDRIKAIASEDIVDKTKAVFVFDVEGEGKWYVDLKNGSGGVGEGDPPEKPEVTISMNSFNFLKMFNRELKPATAFMSGKLTLKGDLSKAMALEAVMKASRGETNFSTWSRNYVPRRYYSTTPPANYKNPKEVFDRIETVANEDMVKSTQAVYVFDVTGDGGGLWCVDLKNGGGKVSQVEPSEKPEVKITMNTENFLKMFNRELKPATAFMSGKLTLSGDLSKALALETVLKASRGES